MQCKQLPAGQVNFVKTVLVEIAANLPTLPKPDSCEDSLAYARAKLSPSRSGIGEKRYRKTDAEKSARIESLCLEIGREFYVHSNQLVKETQDSRRSMLDLRGFLEDWFEIETNCARVRSVFGKEIAFGTFYRVCCEHIVTDHYETVRKYFADYVGYNAEYAGQIIGADGTGFNKIKIVSERNGRFEKRQFLIFVDDASGYVRAWNEVTDSEAEAWPRALSYFINNARFAPEILLCDRVGGLAESLRDLKPGAAADQIKNAALLLLLSAGTKLIVHKPKNPRGKSRTEAGVKQFKKSIVREIVKRARSMELVGELEKRGYEFEDSQQLARFILDGTRACNAREIRGAGKSREALWNLQSAKDRREQRRITANLNSAQNRVLRDAYVSRLKRGTISISDGGQVFAAQLTNIRVAGETVGSKTLPNFQTDPIVLSVPKGVLARDENSRGEYNVILIENRPGQPKFYFADGIKIARNEYGELTHKCAVGNYARLTDSPQQDAVREIRTVVAEEDAARDERLRGLTAAAASGTLVGETQPAEAVRKTKSSIFDEVPHSRTADQPPVKAQAGV